ncbi:MAG TPA: hypothetical protein VEZ55_13530 [Chitinophagaceae bacterium]|nr:hypothetical protein [Chitinophagaceae bacterium]
MQKEKSFAIFPHIRFPMELMMYLGNDLIESITFDPGKISIPGYLGKFKRQLKMKHLGLIEEAGVQPEFLVIDIKPANQPAKSSTFREQQAHHV